MRIITDCLRAERDFSALLAALAEQRRAITPLPIAVNGLSGSAADAAAAEIARASHKEGHPTLLLATDDATCRRLAALLSDSGTTALAYPTRDPILHPIVASHARERERLFVLHALAEGSCDVIVTTPAAALSYTVPRTRLAATALTLKVGGELPPALLSERLIALGYARTDAVEGEGQYAQRGGIFDIFATGEASPVRMEFFGDEIDRMGYFDPITQRIFAPVEGLSLLPSAEVIPDGEARTRIGAEIERALGRADDVGRAVLEKERAMLEAGLALPFADKYISLIYPERECLLSYFEGKARATVLLFGTSEVKASLTGALSLMDETVTAELAHGTITPALARYGGKESDLFSFFTTHAPLHLNAFGGGLGSMRCAALFGFRSRGGVSYADKGELLSEDIRSLMDGKYKILLIASTRAEEAAVSDRLRAEGIPVAAIPSEEPFCEESRAVGTVYTAVVGEDVFSVGFELPTSRIAVLSLFPDDGTRRRRGARLRHRKRGVPAGERLLSYADLRDGDLVVHAVHGIGRFGGMTTMTVDGVTRDYITISYAGTDKLFLPADRLEMISKYIGTEAEGGRVKISRLGGAEWQKTKLRARAAAQDMARDLIALYATRMRRPGHAFPPDDEMQREFENAFAFEETESQLEASYDIKRDMERPVPMDRLLCGDVGYGKTEVALRAAFKAVADGKQVAILVPTTILAMQHYETTLSRMRGFPVTVEMLSRFRTPKQAETILRRVRRGEVDILIGTHKLLSRELSFRDLGLLIIDEEQRFGVAQKEKLKMLAENVDVLTLTATPIPRTLNMAMSGIRDMSLLDEAPGNRLPVETYVMEHDDLIIEEAIRRELRRGGQVIYLYNRVSSMQTVAARLTRALPDAHIVSANGQMSREELEEIWGDLVRGEIDVILCTTIVETGVDLPNAGTLIIEDADRMGLSQLHQLRGRVGRSERQAYAYFTFRTGKVLSEIAAKRLSAIREYAGFGAGFKIALRDLEIRGAGNLLGAEQHGNIEAVGYELYVRLLHEAILEEKGITPEKKIEATVEIRADAHIPERYITATAARMEMYKKISAIACAEDRADILSEFTDRFGKPPRPVTRLLDVALCRALAAEASVLRVEEKGGVITLALGELDLASWSVLFSEQNNLKFSKSAPPCVLYRLAAGEDAAEAAVALLSRLLAVKGETDAEKMKGEPS